MLSLLTVVLNSCSTDKSSSERLEDVRFKIGKVEKIDFDHGGIKKAYVLTDTQTGIEYLYLWSGQASGGPAICRLWKKDEIANRLVQTRD